MCKRILVANMQNNIHYIPYSARRYSITSNGTVCTSSGEVLEKKLINGHYCVELTWVSGVGYYKVALLMLLCFNSVMLPDHLIDQIEPLYADNDCENLSAGNIFYKFKNGPIEVEDLPGYYYIPLYANYAISKLGHLVNWKTKKFKSWSITKPDVERNAKGGYAYSRVVNDIGGSVALFRHRAMCLTFLEYDSSVLRLVVNHKDGVPGNDWIENLEWATYKENNLHAVKTGLRLDNKPVLSKNIKTGEVLRFSSTNECAKHFGHPQGSYVRDRIISGKIYNDYLLFKDDNETPWPDVDLATAKIHIAKSSNKIIARNVFTGDLVVFNGTREASAFTGVKFATILRHVREDSEIPANGWNYRYQHREIIWPNHSKWHLKIYEKYPIYPPDGLFATNVETNEKRFFESVAVGANELKINKHVIYDSIRRKVAVVNGKWMFELFDIRKSLSLPTE